MWKKSIQRFESKQNAVQINLLEPVTLFFCTGIK